ncbi:MAG: Cell division protein FtsA [Chloroflexi bacterium]|nr:Cell division protein FtsA [Chloroflexota bacterium]
MEAPIIVGIDVGTTKICTLIARVESEDNFRILGVGIEPSRGMRKGVVMDIAALQKAIALSIEKAERTSGLEITSAQVSLAGSHVSSTNNKGASSISGGVVDQSDILRALDAAQAVSIPHNREIIHVIQRGFYIDDQDGIRKPIGMHGYRLEVEAHIITASTTSLDNLEECVNAAGVEVEAFILNPLASAEAVLTENEREMGVVVCDIGGGTTDLAIYINGDVWHTMVLEVGGNHITSDIAHGLRLPLKQAEEVKLQHGHALQSEIAPVDVFHIRPFGDQEKVQYSRRDLALVIEARLEEIFSLIRQEIKRSGYDGLLPAGMVLTGGTSAIPGIRALAQEVFDFPARIAGPENMQGMTDQLHSPAYSTSIGLLIWTILMNTVSYEKDVRRSRLSRRGPAFNMSSVLGFLRRLLP